MYINFEKMRQLSEDLESNIACLAAAKEKIENERKKLSSNSALEEIAAQMKKTADSLEEKAEAAKKLRLALISICELYQKGEQRISENTDGGATGKKSGFVTGQPLSAAESFGWSIE